MAPPSGKGLGKGKAAGKGKETFEVKLKRINKEIADATSAQDSEGLVYLWKVKNAHESGASKANGKGNGKGGSKGSFAATNQANVQLQYSGTQLASAVDKAVAAALNKAAAVQTADDKKAENAERNRLKKIAKDEEQAKRKADGNEARPCRLCLQPLCLFKGTYQSSLKCYVCKHPFLAPLVPAPTPPPAAPAAVVVSEASAKAATVLNELKTAAMQIRGYADVAKAAAPPPAAPAAPAPAQLPRRVAFAAAPVTPGAVAKPLPPPPPPQGVAAAAAPAYVPPARTPEQLAAAAAATVELETAKKLNELRAQRNKAASQLEDFADAPEVVAALRSRMALLDAKLLAAQSVREAALEPHQLGQVLTQRQQASSDATLAAKSAQDAADAAVKAFDLEARATDEDYSEHIRSLVAVQAAVQQKALADRADLVARLTKGTVAAHDLAAEAKRLLAQAQGTYAQQSGTAQAEAAAALARQQAAAQAQDATLQEHLRQQELLKQQLADTQAKLAAQQVEISKQQTAMRPSAIVPAAVLPEPSMPEGKDSATAMYSLRASLLLLAEQETPPLVSWGDLADGLLLWPDVCRLVPHHIIEQSVAGIDPTAGPAPDAHVPRRVLELLRKQLDAIVAQWIRENAAQAAVAEEMHSRSAWAQTVLDHAKRLQDLKRHADSSDAQEPASSKPRPTPRRLRSPSPAPTPEDPAMQVDAASSAPAEVDATQPDGTAEVPATQIDALVAPPADAVAATA